MYNRLPQGYKNIVRWLRRRGACSEGISWVKENRFESLSELWDNCHRSDWMLWLLEKAEYKNDKDLRLFACDCVRAIWEQLIDERSRNAVVVAERYANGEATDEELAAASDAAWAAAWTAASDAAWAAAVTAADAARNAAWAAAVTAADDAFDMRVAWAAAVTAADDAALLAQAELLRDRIGNPFKKD